MMKSFFKKLAFVMAMAMVVSLAAPAATASAAETKEFTYKYQNGLGAAVKTVNLAKTGDTVDLKFKGIADYKNYELNWMSYGTGFELTQEGVITATADAGEGVVWLSVGDDQTYVSDPIKVTIGQYAPTIGKQDKSNKALEGLTLKVGDKEDLAFYGILDWNLGKYGYKWVVADTSVLSVDQKTGEITALKAGETTVTFIAPNKFNQMNVVTTNALKVTVEPDVEPAIDAVQKTQNKFFIDFTDLTAANYDENDIEVVCVFDASKDTNGNGVIDAEEAEGEDTFFIKPVTVDEENNRLVVDTYADFVDGNIYEVRVGEYKDRITASVGEVATIELEATKGFIASNSVAAVPAELSVTLYDKNGIDVTTVEVKGIKNIDNIVYEIKGGDTDTYYLVDDEIVFIEPAVVTAYAYFDYYNVTEKLASNPCKVYGSKHEDWVAKVIAWAVVDETSDDKIDWNKVVKEPTDLWVAAGDQDRHVVALLEDSRGNYFATHAKGTTAGTGKKYNDKTVYAADYVDTNVGHSFVFATNGYFVEFETQNPDNLLMYEDGEVITYKETKSSIKLVLHNIYDENLNEPLASVPLAVKPERKITYLSTTSTNVTGVTDTMFDAFDDSSATFPEFVYPTVTMTVSDQYKTKWWNDSDCDEFEVELVVGALGNYTDAEKRDLAAYAQLLENRINATSKSEFKVEFDTKAIRRILIDDDTTNNNKSNRNAVSFKFTETTSGRFVTVQVNLEVPNYTTEYDEDTEIKPDTQVITGSDREKTTMLVNKLDVQKTIDERANWTTDNGVDWYLDYDKDAYVNLFTTSRGYEVGYSQNRLFVAKTLASGLWADYSISNQSLDPETEIVEHFYDDGYGLREIKAGDQILVVVGPDNKIVPSVELGGIDKVTGATSAALGVTVIEKTVDANRSADIETDKYYTYELGVAGDADGDSFMEYIRTGRYTVQVRTISYISKNGKINLVTASSDKTASSLTVTVSNTNGKIQLANQITRDLREEADNIEEVVAEAFNFNYVDSDSNFNWLASLGWDREVLESLVYHVDYRVGDGYVYIKSVTFRVPVDPNGELTYVNKYYLETVAIGSSVKISNDIFFFDDTNNN